MKPSFHAVSFLCCLGTAFFLFHAPCMGAALPEPGPASATAMAITPGAKPVSLESVAPVAALSSQNISTPRGTLLVLIQHLRNNQGQVLVSLYRQPEGFPTDYHKALLARATQAEHKQASVRFEDLPNGAYAIAVQHDENSNFKLDTNWLGIPSEGVGVSNNAKGSFGPPSFKDAVFEFTGKEKLITITVQYF